LLHDKKEAIATRTLVRKVCLIVLVVVVDAGLRIVEETNPHGGGFLSWEMREEFYALLRN
jgi:hypothetical protein